MCLHYYQNDNTIEVIYSQEEGDLWDYLWFVPAPDFIEIVNKLDNGRMLDFVTGRKKKETNKWDQYLLQCGECFKNQK